MWVRVLVLFAPSFLVGVACWKGWAALSWAWARGQAAWAAPGWMEGAWLLASAGLVGLGVVALVLLVLAAAVAVLGISSYTAEVSKVLVRRDRARILAAEEELRRALDAHLPGLGGGGFVVESLRDARLWGMRAWWTRPCWRVGCEDAGVGAPVAAAVFGSGQGAAPDAFSLAACVRFPPKSAHERLADARRASRA